VPHVPLQPARRQTWLIGSRIGAALRRFSKPSTLMPTRSKSASPRRTRRARRTCSPRARSASPGRTRPQTRRQPTPPTRAAAASAAAVGTCIRALGTRGDEGARTVELIQSLVPPGYLLEDRDEIAALLAEARQRVHAARSVFGASSDPERDRRWHGSDKWADWNAAVDDLGAARDLVYRAARMIGAHSTRRDPGLLGRNWKSRYSKKALTDRARRNEAVRAREANMIWADTLLTNIDALVAVTGLELPLR
jgi:hypothetical protein